MGMELSVSTAEYHIFSIEYSTDDERGPQPHYFMYDRSWFSYELDTRCAVTTMKPAGINRPGTALYYFKEDGSRVTIVQETE
jgi:hypothetical protein